MAAFIVNEMYILVYKEILLCIYVDYIKFDLYKWIIDYREYKIENKTKIALNQVFVPKLAVNVKSHKNIT